MLRVALHFAQHNATRRSIVNQQKIATCIRMAMAKADLNKNALAEKMGIARNTAASYANGNCTDVTRLTEIAEACGMTFEKMMSLAND